VAHVVNDERLANLCLVQEGIERDEEPPGLVVLVEPEGIEDGAGNRG
jgi:hypothetical protein